jgi:hypothetical protein
MSDISSSPVPRRRFPAQDSQRPPKWVWIAGAVFGAATLIFFMVLVIAAVLGREVPANSRFLVLVVLAFGAAMSAGFLGGTASAKGTVRLPEALNTPIAVSTTGGVAVLVVVLLVGYYFYVKPAFPARSQIITLLPSGIPRYFIVDNLTPDALADVGQFRSLGNRQFLYMEFLPGKALGKVRLTYPGDADNPIKKVVYQVKTDGELTTDGTD